MKLHSLQGLEYELAFAAEVEHFLDAHRGVPGNDVAAALLLRDCGETKLLARLHKREVRAAGIVDEDTMLDDLAFEEI